ncbi:MAG: antitoxin ParD1/3/4 [Dasania sp.]|jgi:antitoxin ParD1/3/4
MSKDKQKTQTLSLGEYWNGFIANRLDTGRYSSASEVVRDALRLMEETDADSKLKALRGALIEGEESGDGGILNMQEIIDEAKHEL